MYHLFVVRSADRDRLRRHLAARGIETLVHYPVPIQRQPAFSFAADSRCPHADRLCAEVLSLPLYPSLAVATIEETGAAIRALKG